MINFLQMEYLVSLYFIEFDKKEVTFSELYKYEAELNKKIKEKKLSICFMSSNNYAIELVKTYPNCFRLLDNSIISLITEKELISKFISYLSVEFLSIINLNK